MNTSCFRFPTLLSFAQTLILYQSWRVLNCILLAVFTAPVFAAAGPISASEVVLTLGTLSNYNRSNTIASMARSGQILSPVSGSDGAAILQGTTGASRTYAISELAALFKADLNGQEAEEILGPEATLSNYDRSNAIAALARAKRFGPSLAEDAALALKGTTKTSRTYAISEIAPYLRSDLPGQAIATILGSGDILSNYDRSNAIAAIARTTKRPLPVSGLDGATILQGTMGASRTYAISELAALFKADLNGQEAEEILGPEATLSNYDRSNAIAALARAKRFGPSLAEDAALALKGTTKTSRTYAISEIAPYLRSDLPGQAIATILGSGNILSDYDRYNAIAALANSGKLRACMSGDEMNLIMNGTTGASRASAIAEITKSSKPQCIAPVSVGTTSSIPPTQPSNVPIGGQPLPNTTAGTTPTSVVITKPASSPQTTNGSIGGSQSPSTTTIAGTKSLGSFAATVHCKYSASKRTQLDIRWTSSIGASTYEVFRDGVSISAPFTKNVRTFSDLNVPLGKRSIYSVRASNGQQRASGNANVITYGTDGLPIDPKIGSVNRNGDSEVYCFSDEEIKIATANVNYAIFSNNTYLDKPQLPSENHTKWEGLLQGNDDKTGFYAQAYKDPVNQLVVVAFRGTDGFFNIDWESNIGAIPVQYSQAEQFANTIFKLPSTNGVKTVVFTGHSLGGGLAQYVAKKYIDRMVIPEVRIVVFDSSPRTGILSASSPKGTIFISATGEVLQYASLGLHPVSMSLDFLKGSPIDKHSITELACGLVYSAAAKNENVWGTVAQSCDRVSTVRWWVK